MPRRIRTLLTGPASAAAAGFPDAVRQAGTTRGTPFPTAVRTWSKAVCEAAGKPAVQHALGENSIDVRQFGFLATFDTATEIGPEPHLEWRSDAYFLAMMVRAPRAVDLLANPADPMPPVIQVAAKGPRTVTKARPPASSAREQSATLNSSAVSKVAKNPRMGSFPACHIEVGNHLFPASQLIRARSFKVAG